MHSHIYGKGKHETIYMRPYYTIYHTWWVVNCSQFAVHTHTNSSNSWLRSSCIQNDKFSLFSMYWMKGCQWTKTTTATETDHSIQIEMLRRPVSIFIFSDVLRRKRYAHRTTQWEQESKSERDWEQRALNVLGKKAFILHWSKNKTGCFFV